MRFSRFAELGSEIDQAWANVHRNEHALTDIAVEALDRLEPDTFDLGEVSRFLMTTDIQQLPESAFSELPVVLYRGDGFHIEMLVWTESTTAIHYHAFSGAFRVFSGSSLHSEYSFDERCRVSSRLLIGDIDMLGMEVLRTHDVRPIISGRRGPAHALFHLDQPSVTIVVRTDRELEAEPQYNLCRPDYAYDPETLYRDPMVRITSRALGFIARYDDERLPDFVAHDLVQLDLPRLFAVVVAHADLFASPGALDGLISAAQARYGQLANGLRELIGHQTRESSLVFSRRTVTDARLQFFLALLLNATTRAQVFSAVASHLPEEDSMVFCTDCLMALGDLAETPSRLAHGANPDFLALRLGMALGNSGDHARAMLVSVLEGESLDDLLRRVTGVDESGRGRLRQAHRALLTMPELQPLLT